MALVLERINSLCAETVMEESGMCCMVQCAAVTSMFGAIKDPPQNRPPPLPLLLPVAI